VKDGGRRKEDGGEEKVRMVNLELRMIWVQSLKAIISDRPKVNGVVMGSAIRFHQRFTIGPCYNSRELRSNLARITVDQYIRP
jgi:hypothetical protein